MRKVASTLKLADTAKMNSSATPPPPIYSLELIKRMGVVLVCVMPEVLIYHMLHPMYPYIVQSLLSTDAATPTEHIGYYTGLLQSAYFLPSIVSAPMLGAWSDSAGRKRVLLVGLAGYGLGSLMLGVGTMFATAVLAMITMGFFSGNATVAKGMIGDLASDDRTRAAGYSAYGIAYAVCSILGALAGASLSSTKILSSFAYVQTHPYFVPSTFGFLLACVCLSIAAYLVTDDSKTHHASYSAVKNEDSSSHLKIRLIKETNMDAADSLSSSISSTSWTQQQATFYARISPYLAILNRSTIAPLTLYTLYAFANSLLHTSIPLMTSSKQHGYALSQQESAQIATYTATAKLAAKILFLSIHSVLGSLGTYRVGTSLLVPGIVLVSGSVFGIAGLVPGMIAIGVGESWAYLSLVMLITEGAQAVQSSVVASSASTGSDGSTSGFEKGEGKSALGLIHGVSGCLAAIVRTAGPAIAGVVWETSGPFVLFSAVGGVVVSQVVLSILLLRRRRFRGNVGVDVKQRPSGLLADED
ncbi:major facilitator superfamily domain-containing protein [Chytriomyces cf. hyalinus JEL632]|nr:major facilitator superfamily domain-containing protein [Chytriomyces cf. hyalinus JEL632]